MKLSVLYEEELKCPYHGKAPSNWGYECGICGTPLVKAKPALQAQVPEPEPEPEPAPKPPSPFETQWSHPLYVAILKKHGFTHERYDPGSAKGMSTMVIAVDSWVHPSRFRVSVYTDMGVPERWELYNLSRSRAPLVASGKTARELDITLKKLYVGNP